MHVTQVGRMATADKATIDVLAGIVKMMGSAVLEDDRGKVAGEVIIMERGKRRAEVWGGSGSRPKVELPPLPDLRFEKKKKNTIKKIFFKNFNINFFLLLNFQKYLMAKEKFFQKNQE